MKRSTKLGLLLAAVGMVSMSLDAVAPTTSTKKIAVKAAAAKRAVNTTTGVVLTAAQQQAAGVAKDATTVKTTVDATAGVALTAVQQKTTGVAKKAATVKTAVKTTTAVILSAAQQKAADAVKKAAAAKKAKKKAKKVTTTKTATSAAVVVAAEKVLPRLPKWEKIAVPGGAIDMSVAPDGELYAISLEGDQVYHFDEGKWEKYLGTAKGIAAGMNDSLWTLGAQLKLEGVDGAALWPVQIAGGYTVQCNGYPMSGGLTQIAVTSSGQLWGVNDADNIWMMQGITNVNSRGNNAWLRVDGGLVQVSGGKGDAVFGVNRNGQAWQKTGIVEGANRVGTGWALIPTPEQFQWVSIGLDGMVYGVGKSEKLYAYEYTWARKVEGVFAGFEGWGRGWVEISGVPTNIKKVFAGRDGEIYVITQKNELWTTSIRSSLLPDGEESQLDPAKASTVVLISYKNINKPVLIKIEGKYLVAAPELDPKDPSCHMKALWLRDEQQYIGRWWLVLQDPKTGKNLQNCPGDSEGDTKYTLRFQNTNGAKPGDTWEHFDVIPVGVDGTIMLGSQSIPGHCLNLPDGSWSKNRVWTAYDASGRPDGSGPKTSARFKIMTPEEAAKVLVGATTAVTKATSTVVATTTAKKTIAAKKTTTKKTTTAKKTVKKAAIKKAVTAAS